MKRAVAHSGFVPLVATFLLFSLDAPSSVVAQPTVAQGARDPRLDLAAEADLHFELGVERQRASDCRGALEHYLLSNRLAYNRNVVFNIARCFEEVGRFDRAYRYYSDYLAENLEDDDRRAAERAQRRIRPRVALVRVESTPPGARIFVEREDLGSRGVTPRTLAVPAGTTTILIRRAGYEPADASVEARRGREVSVQIALTAVLATLTLSGEPEGAEVRLDAPDGELLGTIPGELSVPTGPHTLVVTAPGRQTEELPIDLAPRAAARRRVRLQQETGTIVVDVQERGARIEIDDEAVGFTPAVLPDVPAGRHRLRITRSGFRPFEEEVEVRPNEQAEVQVRLRLEQEVTAASRSAESVFDAPASVTILPQEELRAFGFQTVWDALGGVRGIYQTNDRSYRSLGVRGFSQPQDYGNRLLVLTDGHVMNDDLLGSSYTGYEGRADLIDVERIEVVRGPGSALYGTNAFLGVVNVVTRDSDTFMRPHVSLATDGFGGGRLRVGGGARLNRDVGMWASAGGLLYQGEDLSLPELSPAADGLVRDADGFYAASGAFRAWAGDFTLQGSYNRRRKRIPTGAFDTVIGDPRAHNTDSRGFVELRWDPRVSDEVSINARVFLDYYEYQGAFPNEPASVPEDELEVGVTRDSWLGYWVGGEARVTVSPLPWLRITAGAEARGSLVADLSSQNDVEGRYLDETPRFFVFGGYAVADVRPLPELSIHLGARYDFVSTFDDGAASPRAAVILRPWETGTFKLIGGSAFRAPSVYELRYNDAGVSQIPPPDGLQPERIWTAELEFTQRIEEELSAIVSVFYNYIENPITTEVATDGSDVFFYANATDVAQTVGAEAELRREWRQGWMLSASYSYQRTRVGDLLQDGDARITNSPEHLVGARGAAPLIPEYLTAAIRLRVESARLGIRFFGDGSSRLVRGDIPLLADVVLSGEVSSIGLSYAVGVRNLLDWGYGLPSGEDIAVPFVPQSGRTFFLQTTLRF